jgi:hypothetical protein
MSLSGVLTIISAFSSMVTIYLGFMFIFEHRKPNWPLRRRVSVAGACLLVLIALSFGALRGDGISPRFISPSPASSRLSVQLVSTS